MFLNDASLPYQYLADSQAENAEKYKYIASLENTLKAKDEHIANHENTLKTKDEHIASLENTLKTKVERIADLEQNIINNSLINSASSGRMAQFSFPQVSQFARGLQGPQVIARTIPPLIVPNTFTPSVPEAFTPSVPMAFQHKSGRSSSRVVRATAARHTPYDQARVPPSYS